jgi:FtsZ-binding cell division protein ZapB
LGKFARRNVMLPELKLGPTYVARHSSEFFRIPRYPMVKTGRTVELEPIDRLEEKVKLLVNMIERLKADAARLAEDNARLARELEVAHVQISEAETASGEMLALREERDLVRARVATMLEQLEGVAL